MAKEKIDKDKLIESLKAENDSLKRRKKLETALETMDKRKKVLILVILLSLLFLLVLLFTEVALKASRPVTLTEEQYRQVLSEIDGRRWTIVKKDLETLKEVSHGLSDGKAKTTREGALLFLELSGDAEEEFLFSFRNGEIRGMVGSDAAYLQYSESTLKTGRALTLVVGERKLSFQEAN